MGSSLSRALPVHCPSRAMAFAAMSPWWLPPTSLARSPRPRHATRRSETPAKASPTRHLQAGTSFGNMRPQSPTPRLTYHPTETTPQSAIPAQEPMPATDEMNVPSSGSPVSPPTRPARVHRRCVLRLAARLVLRRGVAPTLQLRHMTTLRSSRSASPTRPRVTGSDGKPPCPHHTHPDVDPPKRIGRGPPRPGQTSLQTPAGVATGW